MILFNVIHSFFQKTAKSKKSKTQSGQSERLSSLNSSKSSGMCDRSKIEMKSI